MFCSHKHTHGSTTRVTIFLSITALLLMSFGCTGVRVTVPPQVSPLAESTSDEPLALQKSATLPIEWNDALIEHVLSYSSLGTKDIQDFRGYSVTADNDSDDVDKFWRTVNDLKAYMQEKSLVVTQEYLDGIEAISIWDLGDCSLAEIHYLDKQLPMMTRLIPFGVSVQTLDDLQNVHNLNSLTLRYTTVRNLEPLAGLNLHTLALYTSKIEDLSALKGFGELTLLQLGSDQTVGLDALASLANLRHLSLLGMSLENTDLSFLSALTKLEDLELSENSLGTLDSLSALFQIKRLSVNKNQISSLLPIAGLVSIEHLSLNDNVIDEIMAIKHLRQLRYLQLDNNCISNVDALKEFTQLESLSLYGNPISDISIILGMTPLRHVNIDEATIPESQWVALQNHLVRN